MQSLIPSLWFDHNAEEAVNFYLTIFPNSSIRSTARYTDAGPGEPGSVVTISFQLNGQPFVAINGGPVFQFTPAVSFIIPCETQAEVDWYWDKLLEGGQPEQCGWLRDRFGLSWQVVPTVLYELINDPDPQKAERATRAMLNMTKLDIAALCQAHAGNEQAAGPQS